MTATRSNPVVKQCTRDLADQAPAVPAITRLVLIDDDMISREVLAMLAVEAGFRVDAFECGPDALAWLTTQPAATGTAVLTDLQMPGLSGVELAQALRRSCAPATPLLVMSGSPAPAAVQAAYDASLLKPFSIDELDAALAAIALGQPAAEAVRAAPHGEEPADSEFFTHVNRTTYTSLAGSMPAANLTALLALCLDDSGRRLEQVRAAAASGDAATYTRAAHAIKGGCATVGFMRLAGLAARMEVRGLAPAVDGVDESSTPARLIADFMAASTRLRDMLNTRGNYDR